MRRPAHGDGSKKPLYVIFVSSLSKCAQALVTYDTLTKSECQTRV
jgi:hypothetical protein